MAVDLTLSILQIVGYSNSGKTTLITKVIKELSKCGIRVGIIKHHGHGGSPDALDSDKDTAKHRQAGAAVTGVEGAGMLQIHAFNIDGWALKDMLLFYNKLPIDTILIEGFKREGYPKIVMVRSEEDNKLLEQLENIQAIICWYKPFKTEIGVPTFYINDENEYMQWIKTYFERIDSIE